MKPINNNIKLILASHNAKKLAELVTILSNELGKDVSEEIISAADLGLIDPIENGATFEENALIKARAVFSQTGIAALADDSGLIVDIMGRAPGIFSARWAGEHGNDEANNKLLLEQLSDLPDNLRSAYFNATVALVKSTHPFQIVKSGRMHGQIIREMRGSNGFGYDCIFVPLDYENTQFAGLTSAQLSKEQKNAISHRTKAINAILQDLLKLF